MQVLVFLSNAWSISIGLVYFFLPPILFYLNYRLKRRLPIAVVCLISILLGWILPYCQIRLVKIEVYPPGTSISEPTIIYRLFFGPEGPAAIAGIFVGWMASGGILLFWSPIIAIVGFIISKKNHKRELNQLNNDTVNNPL
jgi:hypothetical protein